tara:strand:+ start:338 stop:490 length:153 start_codon:yes stop_codon:yes gene_type:complete
LLPDAVGFVTPLDLAKKCPLFLDLVFWSWWFESVTLNFQLKKGILLIFPA